MTNREKRSHQKKAFLQELKLVVPLLPKYYALRIQDKHPDISKVKIYNVKHYGSVDYKVLDAMKELLTQEQLEKISSVMIDNINH